MYLSDCHSCAKKHKPMEIDTSTTTPRTSAQTPATPTPYSYSDRFLCTSALIFTLAVRHLAFTHINPCSHVRTLARVYDFSPTHI